MGGAVRAALYLWNGWFAECAMYAQAAPEKEQLYLSALCERQLGHTNECKAILQQLEDHPVFGLLSEYSLEIIGLGSDPPLKRFKGVLELGGTWEPFAFVDLYEQARMDKLCHPTKRIVCSMQCREFELLFAHCYEAATGRPLPRKAAVTTVARRKPKPRPKERATCTPTPETNAANSKPEGTLKRTLKKKEPVVGVACPKCDQKMVFPESHRGQKVKCRKCDAVLLIPRKTDSVSAGSDPTS